MTPMISNENVDGIFFGNLMLSADSAYHLASAKKQLAMRSCCSDDALDIPNFCLTPPHGRAPCTGNFTFTAAEQAAAGTAWLRHYDKVLAAMAAKNKGTVMSMNPVTATSYPVNSSQGDGMLMRHRAFHFWEFFGDRYVNPK